jgi:hypothetical protein
MCMQDMYRCVHVVCSIDIFYGRRFIDLVNEKMEGGIE